VNFLYVHIVRHGKVWHPMVPRGHRLHSQGFN
jgi:hypothetical protein